MKIIILLLLLLISIGLISIPYLWAYSFIQPVHIWDWIQVAMWGAGIGVVAIFCLVIFFILLFALIQKFIIQDISDYKIFIKKMMYLIWINFGLFIITVITLLMEWVPYYIVQNWLEPETIWGYWHVFWVKGLINLALVALFILGFYIFMTVYDFFKDKWFNEK